MLEIFTLGGLHLKLAGEAFEALSTRKTQALLVYLAHNRRPQPREFLAEMLWEERSQSRAMTNLRVALTDLRKHLGAYLVTSRETVALNPEAEIWSDALALEAGLAAAGETAAKLEDALALYQGEFLAGFSVQEARLFEEWASVERERLHQLALDGFSQVVDWHLAQGDYPAGIQGATRWLAIDPLNEAAHRAMMRLLAHDGQVGAAIRQYQECVRLLDDELGLVPAGETTGLYEAIQSQRLARPERPPSASLVEEKEPSPEAGEPPFKGLAYYDVDDAHLFFGRAALTAELAGRLRESCFLAVVGASGSGKSSLVRAGLLPALRSGRKLADGLRPPTGSDGWPVHLITPTAHPLKALAVSLTREATSVRTTTTLMDDLAQEPRSLDIYAQKLLAGSQKRKLLLVVDQFEELFSQCRDEAERRAFVDNLLAAVTGSPGEATLQPTVVVITLRADFYAHCARYDGLRELLETHQAYIGQMTAGELRQAIEGPAHAGGWRFEPGLVDLLLHDVGAGRNRKPEPGALPLLSHALLETWRRREREMTFSSYAGTGGVRRAIARTAEAVFNEELSAGQRPIARSIFLRLTELGEGVQDARRRATLAELIPSAEEAPFVEGVLKILADARLVTTGEEGVEVAHEALIREWPRLGEWLAEDREGLRLHRQLTEAAQGWQDLERDEGALYRGARLAQALEWAESHGRELNALERAFLDASQELARRKEAEREAQRQRELTAAQALAEAEKQRADAERRRAEEQSRASEQLRRRRRFLIGALAAASLLALVAILFGIQLRQIAAEAERKSRLSLARDLATQADALFESDTQLSLLLAAEAVKTTLQTDGLTIPEADHVLYQALTSSLNGVLAGHIDQVRRARFSPDGQRIVTASLDGTARLWDGDGEYIATLAHPFQTLNASFSPDGQRIVTTSDQRTARLWDREGQLIATLEGHTSAVGWGVFSPDGTRILTTSRDSTARLWDANGGSIAILEGHAQSVLDGAFSPDGQRILTASADQTARLWDKDGNLIKVLRGHTGLIGWAVFSPDGTRFVTASEDGTARLWTAGGELIATLRGHTGWVRSAVFSPDGERILTASDDGTARLWDGQGNSVMTLEVHLGGVFRARFSPDGTLIVTASDDGTARLWAADGTFLVALTGHTGALFDALFSPDGRQILTASRDGTARLWAVGRPLIREIAGHTDSVRHVTYSPDGQLILTASSDETARLWDSTGGLLHTLEGHSQTVRWAGFSPDGEYIVTASDDGTARLWDLDGELVKVLEGHADAVWWAAFSPDGKVIATASDDGTARLWGADGTFLVTLTGHRGPVRRAVFNPDGTHLVTAGFDGIPRLWELSTLRDTSSANQFETDVSVALPDHGGRIASVAFSPNGERFVTTGQFGNAVLWNADGNILTTLEGHLGWVLSANFSPDGTQIVTAGEDNTARLWNADGEFIKILPGHTSAVIWAGFSPNGRLIATASRDGTARLWSAEGDFLIDLQGHTEPILSAAFSPDGTQFATASEDGTVRLWEAWSDIEAMVAEAERRARRSLTEEECQRYLHLERCP